MDMKNKERLRKISKRRNIFMIYSLGCVLWFIAWYLIEGYDIMNQNKLIWVPFVSCLIILLSNMFLWRTIEDHEYATSYKKELIKIQYVEKNAAHMVTAITGVLIIAAAVSVMKDNASIPGEVIKFESAAFICAVVGVLPKYWVPSTQGHWLEVLRHVKTVPFTFSISFFLGGLLSILRWL